MSLDTHKEKVAADKRPKMCRSQENKKMTDHHHTHTHTHNVHAIPQNYGGGWYNTKYQCL